MKMKFYKYISLIPAALALGACSMLEEPTTYANRQVIFGTEQGMRSYSYSFYNMLPSLSTLATSESGTVDYAACRAFSIYYSKDAYNSETVTSWSWTNLRNINYFLDGLASEDCTVDPSVSKHYEGLARWFRAYFYFNKLATYGEVPWFDHCLSNSDEAQMYKDRDSRDVIIGHIIDDLDFAYQNITTESSVGNTLVSKYAALALKSRACLFEASYRKYHNIPDTEQQSSKKLYEECIDASSKLMSAGFSLNKTTVQDELMYMPSCGAYRSLFYSKDILTNEVILGKVASKDAAVFGDANWKYNSASYGNGDCLSRAFVHTYLNLDGSRFTDRSDFSSVSFINEFKNRDLRLAQTVRGPGYQMRDRSSERVADIVNGVAVTGYHPIKFVEDSYSKNNLYQNENSYPIFRYAEVLLNYAEAKAELNQMTAPIWQSTIGEIRMRAGITGSEAISSVPTTVDTYLQSTFYPDVTNPVILEIRRERAIELCLEGLRVNDLNRWKEGKRFEDLPWTGIHIEALDNPVDINGDGANDYYFTKKAQSEVPQIYRSLYVQILEEGSEEQGLFAEPNPYGGYDLRYQLAVERKWYDDDRQYLHPIPAKVIRDYTNLGYSIDQNPGW